MLYITEKQKMLIDYLFNENRLKTKTKYHAECSKAETRDEVSISSEAQTILTQSHNKPSVNTKIDESIDLQAYIDRAILSNQKAIENAGDKISWQNATAYTDIEEVLREAVLDKYTKLAEVAKAQDNPSEYIARKYGDPTCSWYAGDLSKEERETAWRCERDMLKYGRVINLPLGDSLFRGITINAVTMQVDAYIFDRQIVNAQIGNIMKNNGIDWNKDSSCTFSVDPYSYYITVNGTDEDTKQKMEQALNVGENGKNLYRHIRLGTALENANSTQFCKEGYTKYQAYQNVLEYTGLQLDKLEERDGTYYTEDGQDICQLIKEALRNNDKIAPEGRSGIVDWIIDMIHEVSSKGWNNIKDMVLEIRYSSNGLSDLHQSTNYEHGGDWIRNWTKGKTYLMLSDY